MPRNLDGQSVWRRGHVRLGIVLIVACLVVILALMIKLFILPNHSDRDEDNASNQPTIEASTTRLLTPITSAIEETKSPISSTSSPNQWIVDSHLITQRTDFAAAVMENGQILVSGGLPSSNADSGWLLSSEIYSSLNRKWRRVANMQVSRNSHTLTALQNGKSILAVGGIDQFGTYTEEIYDIETDRWTFLSSVMDIGRHRHTATLLHNGQVLIIGGTSTYFFQAISSVQLYVPSSNTFTKTGSLNTARYIHTATLLNDGLTVLVTGGANTNGYKISTAEIYTEGSWSYTTSDMIVARGNHAAVLLLDGNVLVAGGSGMDGQALSFVEIYNSITRIFSLTQPMACVRSSLTLTLLPSGQVLAVGGIGSTTDECPLVSELYDPSTGQWMNTRLLNTVHYDHMTILINNSVLVIGGSDHKNDSLAQCERYHL